MHCLFLHFVPVDDKPETARRLPLATSSCYMIYVMFPLYIAEDCLKLQFVLDALDGESPFPQGDDLPETIADAIQYTHLHLDVFPGTYLLVTGGMPCGPAMPLLGNVRT